MGRADGGEEPLLRLGGVLVLVTVTPARTSGGRWIRARSCSASLRVSRSTTTCGYVATRVEA